MQSVFIRKAILAAHRSNIISAHCLRVGSGILPDKCLLRQLNGHSIAKFLQVYSTTLQIIRRIYLLSTPIVQDMKKLLALLFLATLSSFYAKAQLTAFAGTDIKVCLGPYALRDSPLLGGSPSAIGGTPPYQYRWKLQESWFGSASFFLNNDTISNPRLKQLTGTDSAHFVLIVTDANSVNAYDTVHVQLSRWGNYAAGTINKTDSDTVTLKNWGVAIPSFPPLKYTWSPGTFLSDSTTQEPLCWSKGFCLYVMEAEDAIGCEGYAWRVAVNSKELSVGTLPLPDDYFQIPNPMEESSTIWIGKSWHGSTLTMYSASGQKILQEVIRGNSLSLHHSLQKGYYYYHLTNNTGQPKAGIVIVGD
jgi:hypothetical protein